MTNKKDKIKISIEHSQALKNYNIVMQINGGNHIIGTRKTEYSANSYAVKTANKFKIQYIELHLYYPQKKEKTLFDINKQEANL